MSADHGQGQSGLALADGAANADAGLHFLRAGKVLQNEIVLGRMSKFMRAKDLLSLRETCPTWNRNFIPELRLKHSPIQLRVFDDSFGTPKDSKYFKKYVELMTSSSNIPFSKYQIDDMTADTVDFVKFIQVCFSSTKSLCLDSQAFCGYGRPGADMYLTRMAIFSYFEACPMNLTELELSTQYTAENPKCYVDDDGNPEPYSFMKTIPNLKKLTFSTSGFYNDEYERLFGDVCRHATRLEYVSLQDVDEDTRMGTVGGMLTALKASTGFGNLNTILLDSLGLFIIEQLAEMSRASLHPLRLKSFQASIDYFCSDFGLIEEPLRNFPEMQSGSLRELQLVVSQADDGEKDPDTRRQRPIRIPTLGNLRSLVLVLSAWNADPGEYPLHVFEENTLASTCPILKSLCYRNAREAITSEEDVRANEIIAMAHGGVEELVLDEKFLLSPVQLSSAFPSVKELACCLKSSTESEWRKIWTIWPQITSLELYFKTEEFIGLDELLTGVPAAVLESMDMYNEPEKMTVEKSRDLLSAHKVNSGLSDLACLQIFKLTVEGLFKLTNTGGYLGLAVASSALQKVDIVLNYRHGTPAQQTLTPECVEFIRAAFGHCCTFDFLSQEAELTGIAALIARAQQAGEEMQKRMESVKLE